MNSENKKKVLIGSVISLFVVSIFIHSKISEIRDHNTEKAAAELNSRGVASLGDSNDFHRNVQWEHELAHELAVSSKDVQTASKATAPTSLEQLMTSSLAGEYSVRFAQGKVKSIEVMGDHPVIVKNYIEFMNQYANLWTVGFTSIEQEYSKKNEIQLKLFDKDHKPSGLANILTDSEGHFLSMTME